MARDEALEELKQAGPVLRTLARDEGAFRDLLEAFRSRDADRFREILDRAGLGIHCSIVCRWLCVWQTQRVCRILCTDAPVGPPKRAELAEFSRGFARMATDDGLLGRLVEAVDAEDAQAYGAVADEAQLGRFCYLLCHCVVVLRCRQFCEIVCTPVGVPRPDPDPIRELRETGVAIGKLAEDEQAFVAADRAFEAEDAVGLRKVLERVGLLDWCHLVCRWLCCWRCFRVCFVLCPEPPKREFPIPQLRQYAVALGAVGNVLPTLGRLTAAELLVDAVEQEDGERFGAVAELLGVARFCSLLCRWICGIVCRPFCQIVCPPALVCKITAPTGCTEEMPVAEAGPGVAVEVTGTAAGGLFDHYTIEWRSVEGLSCTDDGNWSSDGVVYVGGTPTGSFQVFGGTLGWINTTVLHPGAYEVRLCVYPAVGARSCCCTQFSLFKKMVWIEAAAGTTVATPPGPFVDTTPLGTPVASFGSAITVRGTAVVGTCANRKIQCWDVRYSVGFRSGPPSVVNEVDYIGSLLVAPPMCYTTDAACTEAQKRAPWNDLISRPLTAVWQPTVIDLGGPLLPVCKLSPTSFDTNTLPACPDVNHRCSSGKYTLLLRVEDTLSNVYYDTQHIWIDNKPIHVEFSGIEGLASCADLHIPSFAPPGGSCAAPWPVTLRGIVYDEFIDELDTTAPSDNFDHYRLSIQRQGGPTFTVPITPDFINFGPNPLVGTQRVGDPGTRCGPASCPPPVAPPPRIEGALTQLDLRIFDASCAGSMFPPNYTVPPGFGLEPGECCGYVFVLYAQDKTRSDGYTGGGLHHLTSLWPVCVCNTPAEPA